MVQIASTNDRYSETLSWNEFLFMVLEKTSSSWKSIQKCDTRFRLEFNTTAFNGSFEFRYRSLNIFESSCSRHDMSVMTSDSAKVSIQMSILRDMVVNVRIWLSAFS